MVALIGILFVALMLGMLSSGQAQPAPALVCLDKDQQHAAVAGGQAVQLGVAMRALGTHPGEVINARLCHGAKGLEYVLTVLARDGKVTRAIVDARSGTVMGRR
jgi:hypothetical protein